MFVTNLQICSYEKMMGHCCPHVAKWRKLKGTLDKRWQEEASRFLLLSVSASGESVEALPVALFRVVLQLDADAADALQQHGRAVMAVCTERTASKTGGKKKNRHFAVVAIHGQ